MRRIRGDERNRDLLERVEALSAPLIESLGYELVHVELSGTGRGRLSLRLSVDRPHEPGGITIDECVLIHRALERLDAVDDLMPGAYTLDISSPGLSRPLVRQRDFSRHIGMNIQLVLAAPVEGRSRFTGTLREVFEDAVEVELGSKKGGGREEIRRFGFDQIVKANVKPDFDSLFKRKRPRPAQRKKRTAHKHDPIEEQADVASRE